MSVETGIAAQIKNIEAQYGKPMTAWIKLVGESGLTKHTEVVAMLKSKHGFAHGAAHRIGLLARATKGAKGKTQVGSVDDSAKTLYAGKKGSLLPIHEKLMATIRALGSDVEVAAKSGYLSLRRKKQFAMLKPAAKHVDVGLILKGAATTTRLESAASFNALFTHRVRIAAVAEIDKQLVAWLRAAYGAAG